MEEKSFYFLYSRLKSQMLHCSSTVTASRHNGHISITSVVGISYLHALKSIKYHG